MTTTDRHAAHAAWAAAGLAAARDYTAARDAATTTADRHAAYADYTAAGDAATDARDLALGRGDVNRRWRAEVAAAATTTDRHAADEAYDAACKADDIAAGGN